MFYILISCVLRSENMNLKEMCMRTYTELVLFGSLKTGVADANDDLIRFELEKPIRE